MEIAELQRVILRLLARPGTDSRLGGGRHYLVEAVRGQAPAANADMIQEAIWGLIGRGLAYIDISQPAPENWSLRLTRAGRAAADDVELNPDDPEGYKERVRRLAPQLSPLVTLYLDEAINAYYHECYLSASVMLGVAAEALLIETGTAFATWLGGTAGQNLAQTLINPRRNYVEKFKAFRSRLEVERSRIPDALSDNLDVRLNATMEILRLHRNDSGHPTGVVADRATCRIHLIVFAEVCARYYGLLRFFGAP